jgi:hypothetical protein
MGKASGGPAKGKSVIQAVRFEKDKFTEAEASKWWSKNHGRENLVFSDERKKEAMNRTAGSMNRDDYWAWLDDLRVGDDVMLYWTGGSFGHFKGMAKLVRVNPKSVAGALLEPVATETHGGGYPEGHVIIVPRSPTDRRFSEFFNAPMPISVNRIERSSGEKESSMNRTAVAKELVAVAKELTAATSISSRIRNAEAMIKSGGRGVELGIREIDYLSRDMAELHKQMRIIQSSSRMGYVGESVMQEELLGQLENYK